MEYNRTQQLFLVSDRAQQLFKNKLHATRKDTTYAAEMVCNTIYEILSKSISTKDNIDIDCEKCLPVIVDGEVIEPGGVLQAVNNKQIKCNKCNEVHDRHYSVQRMVQAVNSYGYDKMTSDMELDAEALCNSIIEFYVENYDEFKPQATKNEIKTTATIEIDARFHNELEEKISNLQEMDGDLDGEVLDLLDDVPDDELSVEGKRKLELVDEDYDSTEGEAVVKNKAKKMPIVYATAHPVTGEAHIQSPFLEEGEEGLVIPLEDGIWECLVTEKCFKVIYNLEDLRVEDEDDGLIMEEI